MREIVIEDAVVAFAEERGWLAWKLVIAGQRGSPDRWFFKGGRMIIIEFKKPGKTLDGLQINRIRDLRDHGHKVYVIDDIDDGKRLFMDA